MAAEKARYFNAETFRFFNDLAAHNDREWFAKNKAHYEQVVQEPAVRFVADAAPKLRAISPHVVGVPKAFGGSLTRIYRDTRFSKDKRPYQDFIGIHFWHDRAKKAEPGLPGFYLHIDGKEAGAYSGVWHPEGPALKAIRDAMVARPADWKKATQAPVKLYGESLKRPPPGYDPEHPLIEDLKRKDFVGAVGLSKAQVTGSGFMDDFLEAAKRMDALNRFVAKAIKVPW